MHRRQFYFRQKVTADELNDTFDQVEDAIEVLANDFGVFGIVDGGEVIETAPQTMSVDVVGPMIGRDQSGRRLYMPVTETLALDEDFEGNPTVPTTPGESRYVSIQAHYARDEQDPRLDGEGITVYWIQTETLELKVIAGAAGVAPTPPAEPTNALLLGDALLYQGMTVVTNGDLDFTRRHVWQFGAASTIGVDDSGWSKINVAGGLDEVQETFDALDVLIFSRNVAGELTEDVIPSATTVDLGDGSHEFGGIFAQQVTVSGGINAAAGGEDLGSVGFRFDAWLGTLDVSSTADIDGDLTLGADLILNVVSRIDGDLIPKNDITDTLGDIDERWLEAWVQTVYVGTKIEAVAGGEDIGDATKRFDAWLDNLNANTLAANLNCNDKDLTAIGKLTIGTTTPMRYKAGSGGRTFTRWVPACSSGLAEGSWGANNQIWRHNVAAANEGLFIDLSLPHGAELTQVDVRWRQTAGTADLTGRIMLQDSTGGTTQLSSTTTIGGTGGDRTDSITPTASPVTVDRATNAYYMQFDSSIDDDWVHGCLVYLTFPEGADIDLAAVMGN